MYRFFLPFLCLVIALPWVPVATAYTLPDGEVLADPTRPANWNRPKVAAKKTITYTLNYVFSSSSQKKAIINGKTVSEGQIVDSAKVLSIFEGGVRLMVDGRTKTLSLKPNSSFKKTR